MVGFVCCNNTTSTSVSTQITHKPTTMVDIVNVCAQRADVQ